MMHGPAGGRDWALRSEARKARNVSATLARLWHYFKPYWYVLIAIAALVVLTTYIQVWTPDLLGQAVDCYLTPATAKALGGAAMGGLPVQPGATAPALTTTAPHCLLGTPGPDATTNDYIAGLGRLVLFLIGLNIAGA